MDDDTPKTSRTGMANAAFNLLYQAETNDIAEPQGALQITAQRLVGKARNLVLRSHWWTVLRTEKDLPALSEEAEDGRIFLQLPSDCLHVWTVGGSEKGFERREGPGAGRIVCWAPAPVRVVYARDIEDGLLPYEIEQLIGARLAMMMMMTPTMEKLTAADRERIEGIFYTREQDALAIVGSEGGDAEVIHSRAIDALYGVS